MTVKRRIGVLTGTRADYGLLRNLILQIEASKDAELQLFVTGTHLSNRHGETLGEISRDGLVPGAKIPLWSDDDSNLGVATDVGNSIGGFARALESLKPEIIVILGDRLEALAMAMAATVMSIPIAHIHGGEVTEGAMDDAMRHAITKLSYLHFVTTDEHRQRVIQLGEEPSRVFDVGAPIVDAIAHLELLESEELTRQFPIRLTEQTALVTFHPATMDVLPAEQLVEIMLHSLLAVPDLHVIITGTNSDIGSFGVRETIAAFVAEHSVRVDYVESFGQLGYLSTMAQAKIVVGNSSSTVLEAPVLGVPSVLIGDRQAGRPLSASVIVPEATPVSVAAAIERALTDDFREAARSAPLPFGTPGFARRTLDQLVAQEIPRPPRKRFWDLDRESQ